jgi:hypothetical protein
MVDIEKGLNKKSPPMCRGASMMCICEYYINTGIAILPIITAFCLQQQQQKVLYV